MPKLNTADGMVVCVTHGFLFRRSHVSMHCRVCGWSSQPKQLGRAATFDGGALLLKYNEWTALALDIDEHAMHCEEG